MQATITNIQGYSIHDGPGIRTVVFFKGCPLSCKWCANPECIAALPQTGFLESLCTYCGKCATSCPYGAINDDTTRHRINYDLCTGCGTCIGSCYYGALVGYGEKNSVEQVFDTVRRDAMFYTDGGGVTVSGGEPLLYPEFTAALFRLCKDDGISTCIETSGHVKSENLLMLLPLTDFLLFDIKHIDCEKHSEYTARPNDLILENARLAADSGVDTLFRIPLIPGINDDTESIEGISGFLRSILPEPKVQLMPYHRLGDSKYKALGITNELRGLEIMKPDRIGEVKALYERLGVECSISR